MIKPTGLHANMSGIILHSLGHITMLAFITIVTTLIPIFVSGHTIFDLGINSISSNITKSMIDSPDHCENPLPNIKAKNQNTTKNSSNATEIKELKDKLLILLDEVSEKERHLKGPITTTPNDDLDAFSDYNSSHEKSDENNTETIMKKIFIPGKPRKIEVVKIIPVTEQ